MSIFAKFAQVKAEGGIAHIVAMLAKADPKGMSDAELREMESKLDEIGRTVVSARNTANKEQADFDAIKKLRDTRIHAAEVLQAQVVKLEEGTVARKSKETSLSNLLTIIEGMQPDVEREEQEAKDAQKDLAEIETAHTEAVQRFKNARAELDKAQRGMASAKRDRERAERSADAAAVAAGVRQSTSNITSALKAMQNLAQADKDAAAAARLKASSLRTEQPEKDDPNIASAMAEASGTPLPAATAADRLALLKAKAA